MLEPETKNINLGLDRVTEVLHRLGNPHLKFKSIHVAGTNGKGSVCAMLDSILREDGYKVGLYTSPHLHKMNERIRVQGDDIPDQKLEEGIRRIKWVGEGLELTTFEILTCVAFEYFAEQKIEMAVVEVGLGGRLDATNLVKPKVSVITNVDYDHTEYLGDTLEKIAAEKSGIVKRGIPVVTSEDKPAVLNVIRNACRSKGARLWVVGKDDSMEAGSRLLGPHQRKNEAMAVKVAGLLKIDPKVIKAGLKKAHWPGRFHVISSDPVTIVDGAHNGAGARALKETIRELKIKRPLTLVLGMQSYKNITDYVKIVTPMAEHIIVTQSSHPQSATPEDIVSKLEIKSHHKVVIIRSAREALEVARGFNRPVLATGSLFLVADLLSHQGIDISAPRA